MPALTTKDGTRIHYKDWGTGEPVVFSHGWPLNADSWEAQMVFLASNGYRCIAHDRRGHGRSSPPWGGNDMDTYADDLSELIETLDPKSAVPVGFSAGGDQVHTGVDPSFGIAPGGASLVFDETEKRRLRDGRRAAGAGRETASATFAEPARRSDPSKGARPRAG